MRVTHTGSLLFVHSGCGKVIRLVGEQAPDDGLRAWLSPLSTCVAGARRVHVEFVATWVAYFLRHILICLAQETRYLVKTQTHDVY